MKKTIDYQSYLLHSLEDRQEAQGYLNAALTDGSVDSFLLALRNVIEAQGGMSKLAQKTHKSRSSLYKTLSDGGNPGLKSIDSILQALNLRLFITR